MDFFNDLLTRNVESIYPSKEKFLERLSLPSKLRIYLGIDPSSPKIHLGNAIALRKLAEFQNLGHKIILLIGDFTGMIGDPTDRQAARRPLTREQVLENSKNYKAQAEKILKFTGKNPSEIVYNSTWLGKLTFEDVIKLSSHFTVQQLLERDMFQERLKASKPIGLHEFLYPVMQGYDSVSLDVDLEIGGTDQTFNMLMGRELQKELNGKEKFVLTLPLLEGTDGRKMSKSFGNSIDIDEVPEQMYGKLMSIKDGLILKYFEMCTDIAPAELAGLQQNLQKGNPLRVKKKLAFEVTRLYHGEKLAAQAESEFENVVQKGNLPQAIKELEFSKTLLPKPYLYFLIESGLCQSNSQAARLASQGGLLFDQVKISDPKELFNTDKDQVLIRAGKRNYIRLKFV